ncbi:MAG: rhodanese-like domain-containing protein [Acidobacteria bacterium]|nr:rhodanese-like domain-containing protein [Acidobacteriota bacterium]
MGATITGSAHEISRDEIRSRLSDATLRIVDVLARASFKSSHIPGAVSLPLADLPARARAVLPDLSQSIAVYCASFT